MKEEIICDHLVVVIWDWTLSEGLQLEPNLTLDKAKQLIQQQEALKIQQDFLQKPLIKEDTFLDAVRQPISRTNLPTVPPTLRPPKSPPHNCWRCGKGAHAQHVYPAKILCASNATGRAIIVYNDSLLQLQWYQQSPDNSNRAHPPKLCQYSLLEHSRDHKEKIWEVTITVDKVVIKFNVDTGTEVTVFSYQRQCGKPSASAKAKLISLLLRSHPTKSLTPFSYTGDTACNQSTLWRT